jgi:malonyl-CoA decarboxylase
MERELDKDDQAASAVAPVVTHLAARYLVEEKEQNRPLDPVARFHLGNGARLERLNWQADTSPRGLRQSLGVMVSYLYKLEDIEANREAYARNGRIAISDAMKRSLRKLA